VYSEVLKKAIREETKYDWHATTLKEKAACERRNEEMQNVKRRKMKRGG